MPDIWGGGRCGAKGQCVSEYIEEDVCTLYMQEVQDFHGCMCKVLCSFLWILHMKSVCAVLNNSSCHLLSLQLPAVIPT